MKTRRLFLLLLLGFAAAACEKGRQVADITTRQGGHFLVVDPKADYVRICHEGEIDAFKNEAWAGLRIDSEEVKAPSQEEQEIPWEKIEHIDFGAPAGDLGDFCPGLPEDIAAEVHYPDGHMEKHKLEDTTDDGINGLTERGKVVIPLRNVASLKMVPDQKWPWSTAAEKYYGVTLTATWNDGKTAVVQQPNFYFNASKHHGDDTLVSPFGDYVYDYPAIIAGARVDLPWNMLKRIEIESKPGEPRKVKLTFTDGHTEEVMQADANLENLSRDDNPETEVYVTRMDITSTPQVPPKNSGG
ncbi:MAG: hypothetical protein ACM3ZT_02570 [Bacillota bacterium]